MTPVTDLSKNPEISAQFTNLIYAVTEGDVRTTVDAFWAAVQEAYNTGYEAGVEDADEAWERDLDVVEEYSISTPFEEAVDAQWADETPAD